MSFAALSPAMAWLVVAVAVALAAAAFMIPPRPSRLIVPSLIVWRRLTAQPEQRSRWDWLRRAISLVLTLAIAGTIALALARPVPATGDRLFSRTLIVIDSSWSMSARTATASTRWAQALDQARELARQTPGEVAVATTADGVIESPTLDKTLIQAALKGLAPGRAPDGTWPRVSGTTDVHFFTDGATARPIDPDVIVHSVFAPVPNVAVTAFEVTPSPGAQNDEAFVAVTNYAADAQMARLVVTRGSAVILDRSVALAAGAVHQELVRVTPEGDARFHAHVSATANGLDIDDDRVAWLSTARPLDVTVVGSPNGIAALLAKDRTVRVTSIPASAYAQAAADVWIFNGWLPPSPPSGPALVIDPPTSSWFGAAGADERGPVWRPHGTADAMLDGIDTSLVHLERAHAIRRPSLLAIATSDAGTPLVSLEEGTAGRFVVLGFPAAADFAATPAFPVLIGNAIDWLGRPDRDRHRQPGPVVLPAATDRVIAPNGTPLPLSTFEDRVTTVLPEPGLFLVRSKGVERVLAVELGDPERSNLLTTSVVSSERRASPPSPPGRPWWIYASLVALGLVGFEWMTWRRRVTF